MADFLISDFSCGGEPAALATVELRPDETPRLAIVSSFLADFGARWVPLCYVYSLRKAYRQAQLALPADRIVCDCPDLGEDRVALLTTTRRGGRLLYPVELLGRRAFERRWQNERNLTWRFLARFTER